MQSIPVEPSGASGSATGDARLELQTVGISDLFRGFFGDPKYTAKLQADLGACVSGLVVVRVSYDEAKRVGEIRLIIEEDGFRCAPVVRGDQVDLNPLAPAGQALARYRDAIAGAFDIRIASFLVLVEGRNSKGLCKLRAVGQHPPDGTTFSGCFELDGQETCQGARMDGVTAFTVTPAQATTFTRCFSGR